MSFTILNVFLSFFAEQLVKFTQSPYFTVESLKAMLEERGGKVREQLVRSLLEVSTDFAQRSANVSSAQVKSRCEGSQ